MPTYDYKCENCGHQFEAFQSMKDESLKKCPVCGEEKLKRLIGAGAGLIFKGSGFYLTDYKNKKEPEKSTTQKEKAATPENKSSEKSTNPPQADNQKSSATNSEKNIQ